MIMELEELKSRWNELDHKLEKNLQLNMHLLRTMNLDKARFELKKVFAYRIFGITIFLLALVYLITFILKNYSVPKFSIPVVFLIIDTLCFLFFEIKITLAVLKIQLKNNEDTITTLYKKTRALKLGILAYAKFSTFLFLPIVPLGWIVAFKQVHNEDFLGPNHINYFIKCTIVWFALAIPFFVYAYQKLSRNNINPWRGFLVGTGWHEANEMEGFLNEIEKFEQE